MPKNFKGTNTKAVAARERRATAEADRVAKKQKDEEDEFWRDDDKHVARKQQRKSEKESKRSDQLERKKELALELEKEETAIATAKASSKTPKKITRAEIRASEEARQQAGRKSPTQEADSRVVVNPDLLEENPNQAVAAQLSADGGIEARSVTDAIAALSVSEKPLERHPERRLKATYASFEETRLAALKLENPSLRQSQLRQMIRKEWTKSPENPMNQEHTTFNA
ncbi:coiled-coil domain-containing protein 124-like [Sycon ciliatum]|uniref:coiled-coil domain-containing protein 124-like n=1 Tax=Sycon ciliatum TaxID=27933 RepID=UPI0020A8525E|eukprot:scpid64203/ scgid7277/ Coiled-coil domain-containing protein 124-A